jgi:uncharacterized membrane protein
MALKVQTEIRNFLDVNRIVALVWAFIGAIVALVGILGFVLDLFSLHFSGGSLFLFFYGGLWMLTSIFIFTRSHSWISLAESAKYGELRQRLLLWLVMGILFGVVCGILLLIVYFQTDVAEAAGNPPLQAQSPPPPIS